MRVCTQVHAAPKFAADGGDVKPGESARFGPEAILAGKLVKAAFVFLGAELVILLVARQVFLSSLELSQAMHDFFARGDEFTSALRRLKAFYEKPIDGVEFSQVFGIYLLICLSLIVFLLIVVTAAASGVFKSERCRGRALRDYLLSLTLSGIGVGTFCVFLFLGPAARGYRGLIGQDFITSMCMLVPAGQFLILLSLILCFVAGNSSRSKV